MSDRTPHGKTLMQKLRREPFVHFVALGALIFAAYGWVHPRSLDDQHRLEVTQGDLEALRATSVQQWGKAPNAQQMDDLVQSFVREEVLYREAVASGLDRDDVIVRRRLAQKMEFLAHEDVRAPDEVEQRQYYAAHVAQYLQPASIDLEQLYFSADQHGAATALLAHQSLKALNQGKSAQGDNFMLARALTAQTGAMLVRDFGQVFADSVLSQPVGRWLGPIPSAHGLHLVRVLQRSPQAPGRFEELRDRIAADMVNERVASARDAAFNRLLAGYTVVLPKLSVASLASEQQP